MANLDSFNMMKIVDELPLQLERAMDLGEFKVLGSFTSIAICGMGGSGHPGDMLSLYAQNIKLKMPVFIIRDYNLPEFITSSTLVFAISYSGNTEETIFAMKEALRRNCKVAVITSGGKMRKMADEKKLPLILVPEGIQPRLSLGYMFVPILRVLAKSGIIKDSDAEIKGTISFLKTAKVKEQAKQLASKFTGKVPLIYCSAQLDICAYIWKILINECSKAHAFSNVLPEMNHNEINAFKNLQAKYYAVFLVDELDHERTRARMDITKDIISKAGIDSAMILLKGQSFLTKMFTAIQSGMYVSYYLALSYNTDPTPVPVIEELKGRLKKQFKE